MMKEYIEKTFQLIRDEGLLSIQEIEWAEQLYQKDQCTLLTQAAGYVVVLVESEDEEREISLEVSNELVHSFEKRQPAKWNVYSLAALYLLEENSKWLEVDYSGKKYTREGMIRRVMN